ncbi:MAG: TonB-dependent receptor, partial [Casimicrobiaceae bacterium]
TSRDLTRDGASDLVRALNRQLGGVTLDSASGNAFQPTLLYHGFAASPLQGTPQGLAVYVNGMRFNQPFGDTVDWDLVPDIAIDRIDVVGSNPVFGLNALGGGVNLRLKNGFDYHGIEADVSGGSFSQAQGEFQFGRADGNTAAYVAGDALQQSGWRDLQSSRIQNLYTDFGWCDSQAEVHLDLTFANSRLNGPGTSPVELLAADRRAQFTAPNAIYNRYFSGALTGEFDLSRNVSVQALGYYRHFRQQVINGNAPNDGPCDDNSGLLCGDDGVPSTTSGGVPIPDFLAGGPYSELDMQTTVTNAYGASVQLTDTASRGGLRNHWVAGLAFDGAHNDFSARSAIGGLTSPGREFIGPGVLIDEPGSNVPVDVAVSNANYGVYVADTLNLTQDAALTASGRYNDAEVRLEDHNGGDLSGDHRYAHFNPALGATYRVAPSLTAYAGYAIANRTPTPAELSCAGPNNSCSLANFFVGDPDLAQVIAHTVEIGVRGAFLIAPGAKLTYGVGVYRSDLDNDIAFINSVTQGRAYFANIGQTQRAGVDVHAELDTDRWHAYAAYSYIKASYRAGFVEASGDNPAADIDGNLDVRPGDRLPGIPAQQLKVGAYYKVNDRWTLGASGIAVSGAYLFGDEANVTPKLPGYYALNLAATFRVTRDVELFASVDNVTDQHYYTFGTFSPTRSVFLAETPDASDPRSYSIAAPVGAFVGVRMRY